MSARMEPQLSSQENLKHRLRTSAAISRMVDQPLPPPTPFYGVPMAEPTTTAVAGGILAKLLPAGLGAALMVAVDPPKSRKELAARIFVAFIATYLFGDTFFDLMHGWSWFAFLDHSNRAHTVAIDSLVGAFGWTALGGASMWAAKFRNDPVEAVKEAKDAL